MTQEETIFLHFSCLNLPLECAQGSRLAVTARTEQNANFIELGQTETLPGINPKFQRPLAIVLRLDLDQQLRIILYSVDASSEVIRARLGQADLSLLTLVLAGGGSGHDPPPVAIPLQLDSAQKHPQPSVVMATVGQHANDAETGGESAGGTGTVFQFHGHHLDSPGLIPAPYFTLELVPVGQGKQSLLLHRSEVAHRTVSPRWLEFLLPNRFFPASADWNLRLCCFNFNYNRHEDLLIGSAATSFYQLLGMNAKFLLRQGQRHKDEASIELVRVGHSPAPSLIGCLGAGQLIHPTVAVDFTADNGGPNSPDSLHFLHPHSMNSYMTVLAPICAALSRIEKLGRVSLLGFGAKIPPQFVHSNIFALNGDPDSPYVRGAADALNCYRKCAMSVLPYAPTEFAEVMHSVVKLAKAAQRRGQTDAFHFLLVILTNGQSKNQRDAVDTIVEASGLPVSVVFLPVGNHQHPANQSALARLASFTLKSSNNAPLLRETVAVLPSTGDEPIASLLQQIMQTMSRQMVLHKLAMAGGRGRQQQQAS